MSPDDDREAARSALVVLRTRVDRHFTGARERSPDAMQCRSGCDRCCHARLSVFAIEAERIALALAELAARDPALRARVRAQADDPLHADRCALLVDGRCAVYDERPLLCRSHGLPTVFEHDDGTVSHACCPLNFVDEAPPRESVLRVAAIDQPLAIMARMHDGHGHRVALSDLARG